MIKSCQWCSAEFNIAPAWVRKGGGKFCGRSCAGKWQSKYRVGELNSNWRPHRETRICEQCSAIFKISPSRVKAGQGKYCSRQCHSLWMSLNLIGSLSFYHKLAKLVIR